MINGLFYWTFGHLDIWNERLFMKEVSILGMLIVVAVTDFLLKKHKTLRNDLYANALSW